MQRHDLVSAAVSAAAAAALWFVAGAAQAHTAWLEPAGSGWLLRFGGHEGQTEGYAPDKLKAVAAVDAQGRAVALERSVQADGVRVTAQGAALLTLHFDNGFFSRAEGGRSVNLPMDRNPGATRGTHAVKYGKTVARWGEVVTRPLGQPFEVVPLSAQPPRAGQPLRVRVLIDGRPAAGIEVARGDAGVDGVRTDAAGVASFVPRAGQNRLWSGRRTPVGNDARMTELSVEYVLLFEALP